VLDIGHCAQLEWQKPLSFYHRRFITAEAFKFDAEPFHSKALPASFPATSEKLGGFHR
jgi:hypothetical protein